jgi:glycosyltransferase involved in cell wall biosynthesis
MTGVLISPGDQHALEAAVRLLAGDMNLRTELGKAGRELAEKEFRSTDMVDRLEALYQAVISGSKTT